MAGEEEEAEAGWAWAEGLVFACSYAISEIECCLCACQAHRPHTENIITQIDGVVFVL